MINKIIHFFYSLYNPYPCGRTKETQYLCCMRGTPNRWNSYLSKDKKECYCRFCNHLRMQSTHPINKNHPWD